MRYVALLFGLSVALGCPPAVADYRITDDHGGYLEQYKARYAALIKMLLPAIVFCTVVLGIVPLQRICATPRASLGFHLAYYDTAATFGVRVTSYAGTEDLVSHYPGTVKDWIDRNGGLTNEMKRVRSGPALWAIVDPCPEEF